MKDCDFGNTGLDRSAAECRQALGPRGGVRRARRVSSIAFSEMVQDPPDHTGLGDERHDAHFAAAVFCKSTGRF